jgi:hypothetical protein
MIASSCCCCDCFGFTVSLLIEEYSTEYQSACLFRNLVISVDGIPSALFVRPSFDGSVGYFVDNPDRTVCPITREVLISSELTGSSSRYLSILGKHFDNFDEFKNYFISEYNFLPTVIPYIANGLHYYNFNYCLSGEDIWSLYEDVLHEIIFNLSKGCINA